MTTYPVSKTDEQWRAELKPEEYARHLGHADLVRECLDGVTGY